MNSPICFVVIPLSVALVAFQCQSGVRGRVIAVDGTNIIIYFDGHDSLRTGEKFSLWRDREQNETTVTFRSAIVTITTIISSDGVKAKVTYGHAEVGDKATKWLIEE